MPTLRSAWRRSMRAAAGRVRADREVIVQVQQHRRMRLGRDQQVAEAAEHVRADGFALKAAGKPGEQLLVHRDREVVGPELRQALDPRALGADRVLQACGRLAHVDRSQELAELHRLGHGERRLRGARLSSAPGCRGAARAPAPSVCAAGRKSGAASAGGAPRSCARSHSRASPPMRPSSPGRAPSPKRLAAMAELAAASIRCERSRWLRSSPYSAAAGRALTRAPRLPARVRYTRAPPPRRHPP